MTKILLKYNLLPAAAALIILFLLNACRPGAAEPDYKGMTFSEIEKLAENTTVSFYMWGGDAKINTWIDSYVSEALFEQYNIKLKRVPMDAPVFVNKLLSEKVAGKQKGSIDLLWINGENFKQAKTEGLLYGPYSDLLPNMKFTNPAEVSHDFGFPVEGYEVPYGRAQFVFEYDSARILQPPQSMDKLIGWIKANPGRFTYPAPPDFTGSAFLRHVFYYSSGGHEQFLGRYDRKLFEKSLPGFEEVLKDIKPFLWKEGNMYPSDKARLDLLFEQGEVDFNMSYTQSGAQGRIIDGRYPETARTFVLTDGAISNIHFTAVPFNSPNKPGAMIVSNFLLSVEAQYSKNKPENWGDFTVLDMSRLPDRDRNLFDQLDLGAATLPVSLLNRYAVPEILPEYVYAMTNAWQGVVFGK